MTKKERYLRWEDGMVKKGKKEKEREREDVGD